MNETPKSPFYRSVAERRAALFDALEKEQLLSEDAEKSTNFEVSNEVEKERNAKNTLDIHTPWSVLVQQAMRHPGIVTISQNKIDIAGDEEAAEIASLALKKCALRLYKETESSPSRVYDILLEELKNNRVARRSLASTVRLFRALETEDLEELQEEQQIQDALALEAKQKARKQAKQNIQESSYGDPNLFTGSEGWQE